MKGLLLVRNTLEDIEQKYGVQVVIKDMYSLMQTNAELTVLLRRFFAHENPFCMFIKSIDAAQKKCRYVEHIELGRKMNAAPALYENGTYITCPFGVREYCYPINSAGHTIGALLFGYSACDKMDVEALHLRSSMTYGHPPALMTDIYNQHILPAHLPNTEEFRREVALCGEMLSMLCDKLLSWTHITDFFRYDFVLQDSHTYIDRDGEDGRMVSKNMQGENRSMTIVINAISYIHDNYKNRITIDDIARYCYCSSSTLSHVFAKNYGMTIGKLLHTVRCDRAKELLREASLSIGEIASECGFSSADYFASVFKTVTGFSPSTYRHQMEEKTDM